jgi:hypothetical protein
MPIVASDSVTYTVTAVGRRGQDTATNPCVNPVLVLLGQGSKKSPIGQKLDFINHPYLRKDFY